MRVERVDDRPQTLRVLHQGRDVVEVDTRLGEVRNFPDEFFQMLHEWEKLL